MKPEEQDLTKWIEWAEKIDDYPCGECTSEYENQGGQYDITLVSVEFMNNKLKYKIDKQKVLDAIDKVFDIEDEEDKVHNKMLKKELGLDDNTLFGMKVIVDDKVDYFELK